MSFSNQCPDAPTLPLHREIPKLPHPDGFSPETWEDIIEPWAQEAIRAWFKREFADLNKALTDVANGRPVTRANTTLALGASAFKPGALGDGNVWDLRQTPPVLLGYGSGEVARPPMSLDVDATLSLLKDSTDLALQSIVREGVIFQSDGLGNQIVLNPFLLSGLESQGAIADELAKLVKAGGMHTWASGAPIPLAPIRVSPQGAVSKGDGDDVRRTNDGGSPRQEMTDTDGKPVISHNAAIGIRVGHQAAHADGGAAQRTRTTSTDVVAADTAPLSPSTQDGASEAPVAKYPLEMKPTIAGQVHDIAILSLPAALWNLPLFMGVRDWKGFFNVFPLNPVEKWKCVYVHVRQQLVDRGLDSETEDLDNRFQQDLTLLVEDVLGFGLSAGSNIAQRLSSAVAHAIVAIFTEEDTQYILDSAETDDQRDWIEHRKELSITTGRNELRLMALNTYTDDSAITGVGAERMARFWVLFSKVSFSLNLRFSSIDKQHLGGAVPYLGHVFDPAAGTISIMEHKRVHMLERLSVLAAAKPVRFDELQSLVGMLLHLRQVYTYLDLAPFFSSFSYGSHHGPATQIIISKEARALASEWIHALNTVEAVDIVVTAIHAFRASGEKAAGLADASALQAPAHHRELQQVQLNHLALHREEVITIFSDACLEGAAVPGIGLYCHGFSVYIPLPKKYWRLGISPLELGGVGLMYSIIAWRFPMLAVSLRTDSAASLLALLKGTSLSPAMRAGVQAIKNSPFAPHTRSFRMELSHQLGIGNLMADALSRANFDLYHQLCRQYGVRDRPIVPPDNCLEILDVMLEADDGAARSIHEQHRRSTKAARTNQRRNPGVNLTGKEYSSDVTGDGPSGLSRHAAAAAVRVDSIRSFLTTAAQNRDLRGATRDDPAQPRGVLATARHRVRTPPPGTARRRAVASTPATHGSAAAFFAGLRGKPNEAASSAERTRVRPIDAGAVQHGPKRRKACEPPVALVGGQPNIASGRMQPFLAIAYKAASLAPEPKTLQKDRHAYALWSRHCRKFGAAPLRRLNAHANLSGSEFQNECDLIISFVVHLRETLKPSRKAHRDAKMRVKSDTLQGYVSAIKRVHARQGFNMVHPPLLAQMLKGWDKEAVRVHGPAATTPHRPEPLDARRLRAILQLPDGTQLGRADNPDHQLHWDDLRYASFAALLCTGLACGFRKAEMVPEKAEDIVNGHCLNLLKVSYSIKGTTYANPNLILLKRMGVGDYIIIEPPLAKNDPTGVYFTQLPIHFEYRDNTLNACKRLVALAILRRRFRATPPAGITLANTPLFCDVKPWLPLTQAKADGIFRYMKNEAFSPAEAAGLTLHSLRVACATAMLRAGASDAEIQAIVRWRSSDSVRIYAKTSPAAFAKWQVNAESTSTTTAMTRNLCTIDLSQAQRARLLQDALQRASVQHV